MSFTSKNKNKPTTIDGHALPPGIRPKNATMRLVRDKDGKASFKIVELGVPETVTVGRTTINHLADGPYSRRETAEINAEQLRKGLPVQRVQQHWQHSVSADLTEKPSELARSLASDKGKVGVAKKAGAKYAEDENARRKSYNGPQQTSVSVRMGERAPRKAGT
ncbi:MAG: hypothetical protein GEV13_03160 [Rhodospirillales bacterium]|nr:hypothetical protein [Rhodospirillales bacterium]